MGRRDGRSRNVGRTLRAVAPGANPGTLDRRGGEWAPTVARRTALDDASDQELAPTSPLHFAHDGGERAGLSTHVRFPFPGEGRSWAHFGGGNPGGHPSGQGIRRGRLQEHGPLAHGARSHSGPL